MVLVDPDRPSFDLDRKNDVKVFFKSTSES